MVELIVDETTAGLRPDRALRVAVPTADRALALKALKEGRIVVNGKPAGLRTVLAIGDSVVANVKVPVKRGAGGLGILFLDEHLCIIDKPGGVATHPAPGVEDEVTVLDLVAQHLASRGLKPARPPLAAGRLDRGTTGVLVVTLSREAERALAGGGYEKTYLALVHGVTQPYHEIHEPLVVSRYRRGEPKVKKLKDAVTRAERVAHSTDASLLRVNIDTGRMHQIRRHLRVARHPVVGDGRYGLREDRGAQDLCLHAWMLTLLHPTTGKRLELRAPLPAHFRRALKEHHVAFKEP